MHLDKLFLDPPSTYSAMFQIPKSNPVVSFWDQEKNIIVLGDHSDLPQPWTPL